MPQSVVIFFMLHEKETIYDCVLEVFTIKYHIIAKVLAQCIWLPSVVVILSKNVLLIVIVSQLVMLAISFASLQTHLRLKFYQKVILINIIL